MCRKIAVIAAAGNGTRMGSPTPKQYLLLQGKPVLWHSILAFQQAFDEMEILLVVSPQYFALAEEIRSSAIVPGNIQLVAGGDTRFESVRRGLENITGKNAIVFVHDGARCLIKPDLIRRCYEKAKEMGNAVPAIKPVDSIRIETATGNKPVHREKVSLVQTPQTFKSEIIKSAYHQPYRESFTDEAAVVEESGIVINLIPGDPGNIKITTPMDLEIAEMILSSREWL